MDAVENMYLFLFLSPHSLSVLSSLSFPFLSLSLVPQSFDCKPEEVEMVHDGMRRA